MCSDDQDKGDTDLPDNSSAWIPPHLHLSDSLSNAFNLAEFLQSSPEDPAFHVRFLIFGLTNQLRWIYSGLHPKAEGPSPVTIAE